MFVLLHYLTIVYADSMYRALGAAAPDLVIGNAISSFILLISLVTSGFTIIKSDIPGWWIWGAASLVFFKYYCTFWSLRRSRIRHCPVVHSFELWSVRFPG